MKFIDILILLITIGILGLIINSYLKKDKDVCKRCLYRRDGCNCQNKQQK